jgi:hypothetical protein
MQKIFLTASAASTKKKYRLSTPYADSKGRNLTGSTKVDLPTVDSQAKRNPLAPSLASAIIARFKATSSLNAERGYENKDRETGIGSTPYKRTTRSLWSVRNLAWASWL